MFCYNELILKMWKVIRVSNLDKNLSEIHTLSWERQNSRKPEVNRHACAITIPSFCHWLWPTEYIEDECFQIWCESGKKIACQSDVKNTLLMESNRRTQAYCWKIRWNCVVSYSGKHSWWLLANKIMSKPMAKTWRWPRLNSCPNAIAI